MPVVRLPPMAGADCECPACVQFAATGIIPISRLIPADVLYPGRHPEHVRARTEVRLDRAALRQLNTQRRLAYAAG